MTHLATLLLDDETEIRVTAAADTAGEVYLVLNTFFLTAETGEWIASQDHLRIPADKFAELTVAVREALARRGRDARPEPVRH